MKRVFDFLGRLRRNNNREWFQAHKGEYLEVKRLTDEFATLLIQLVSRYDPEAIHLTPAACTYRIYRDTRFSHDKTPYKEHIGIFINPPKGKKGLTCGYYFHLEPGASMMAAGTIGHPPAVLKAIRRSIVDETDEYLLIIDSPEFKRFFPAVGDDLLKTAPKGFDKTWEHIDLLKPRNFVACCNVPDDFYGRFNPDADDFPSEEFGRIFGEPISQMARFNRFMNYTIEDFDP